MLAQQMWFGGMGVDPVLEWACAIRPGVLQSFMQKAVRRFEIDLAVRAAASMWSQGYKGRQKVVRRVPVVIIEDAVLSPGYDRLIDVMIRAGRKTYREQAEDLQVVLDVVAGAAASPIVDFWHPDDSRMEKPMADRGEIDQLPERERKLVVAMLRRISYGGMWIDRRMLGEMAQVWTYRFLNEPESAWELIGTAYADVPRVDMSALTPITKKDLRRLPMAIDPHCSGIHHVLARREDVRREIGGPDELDDLMWRMEGGINFKTEVLLGRPYDWVTTEKDQLLWEWIKDDVRQLQMWWIDKRL